MKLTVVIGCFNEKNTILQAVEEAIALPIDKEILVIDNASTDGTQEILRNVKNDAVKIVFKDKNYGAGHSAKMGINMAKGEYLYGPGADLEYRMSDVLDMFKKLESEGLDGVFGSRLYGEKRSRWALLRERPFWLGSFAATFLINTLFNKRFTDVIAPKLLKVKILKEISAKSNGHTFEFESASYLSKKGYKIGEVPIYYKPRTSREGKTIKIFDMVPAILAIFRIKLFG